MNLFTVRVPGRPAPQGSKKKGAHGQMREASPYLPAWRAAVKEAVYRRYRELGIAPGDLPLFCGAVGFSACYDLDTGHRLDGPPDLDKLIRATWDALKLAKLIEDDSRFVVIAGVRKVRAHDGRTGADIAVWPEGLKGWQ